MMDSLIIFRKYLHLRSKICDNNVKKKALHKYFNIQLFKVHYHYQGWEYGAYIPVSEDVWC